MQKKSSLFITGTDTGVGKSIFTALLANSLLNEGIKIAISKPIQSGYPNDTEILKELTGNKIPIFNNYSLTLPAAPSVAAKHENTRINIKKIITSIKELEKEFDFIIVEGVGGIAVPILDSSTLNNAKSSNSPKSEMQNPYLVADLIKDLGFPTIVVAKPDLGTINHSTLTIDFAKSKGLNILGFVLSGYDFNSKDPVIITNPNEIEKNTGVKCLFKIPKLSTINYKSVTNIDSLTLSSLLSSISSISSSSKPSSPANV